MPIYEYVSKSEYQPVKNKLIKLINLVQDELRDKFTFSFHFIGSSSRNMVTRYKGTNVGYDFDCNLYPNDKDEEYNAAELKHLFMEAFNALLLVGKDLDDFLPIHHLLCKAFHGTGCLLLPHEVPGRAASDHLCHEEHGNNTQD